MHEMAFGALAFCFGSRGSRQNLIVLFDKLKKCQEISPEKSYLISAEGNCSSAHTNLSLSLLLHFAEKKERVREKLCELLRRWLGKVM